VEQANAFLREKYIGEFNTKFSVASEQKGTASALAALIVSVGGESVTRQLVGRQFAPAFTLFPVCYVSGHPCR
jgi:hypothetical protein